MLAKSKPYHSTKPGKSQVRAENSSRGDPAEQEILFHGARKVRSRAWAPAPDNGIAGKLPESFRFRAFPRGQRLPVFFGQLIRGFLGGVIVDDEGTVRILAAVLLQVADISLVVDVYIHGKHRVIGDSHVQPVKHEIAVVVQPLGFGDNGGGLVADELPIAFAGMTVLATVSLLVFTIFNKMIMSNFSAGGLKG